LLRGNTVTVAHVWFADCSTVGGGGAIGGSGSDAIAVAESAFLITRLVFWWRVVVRALCA
jgi:hypothetical protein